MIRQVVMLGVVTSLMFGCSAPPPLNFSPEGVPVANKKIDADLKSIAITIANRDEQTGEILPDGEELVGPWKDALTNAINESVLFNDDSARHVSLSVKILHYDAPKPSLALEFDVDARYTLTDRKTGVEIFGTVISSKEFSKLPFLAGGFARARDSLNRAIQSNIIQFIEQLENKAASGA